MSTHYFHDVNLLIRMTVGADALTVVLDGELDYDTSASLLATIDRLLQERDGHVHELRLDCRKLRLVDTMGLSTLLQIHRQATAAGVSLHLEGRQPALDQLLHLTGTWEHFTRTEEAADDAEARTGQDGTGSSLNAAENGRR